MLGTLPSPCDPLFWVRYICTRRIATKILSRWFDITFSYSTFQWIHLILLILQHCMVSQIESLARPVRGFFVKIECHGELSICVYLVVHFNFVFMRNSMNAIKGIRYVMKNAFTYIDMLLALDSSAWHSIFANGYFASSVSQFEHKIFWFFVRLSAWISARWFSFGQRV